MKTHIFIGQNHTGSWSFSEAIRTTLKSKFYQVDSHTLAQDTSLIPTHLDEINLLRKNFKNMEPPVFIYSHIPVPFHLALNNQSTYLTLLRNPIDRMLSCYYWLIKHRHANVHWVPDNIKAGASLVDWLSDYLDTKTYPGGFAPVEYFNSPWKNFELAPNYLPELDTAKFVLNNYFSFIGITEYFDESLYIFSKILGLKEQPKWKMLGNSDRPPTNQCTKVEISLISQIMATDILIYDYFKDIFLKKYLTEIKFFNENIKTLRLNNEVSKAPII